MSHWDNKRRSTLSQIFSHSIFQSKVHCWKRTSGSKRQARLGKAMKGAQKGGTKIRYAKRSRLGNGRFRTWTSHRLHRNALQNEREPRKMRPRPGEKVGDAGVDVWQVTCDPQWCWWSLAGRCTCLGRTPSALKVKRTVTLAWVTSPVNSPVTLTGIDSISHRLRVKTIESPSRRIQSRLQADDDSSINNRTVEKKKGKLHV